MFSFCEENDGEACCLSSNAKDFLGLLKLVG